MRHLPFVRFNGLVLATLLLYSAFLSAVQESTTAQALDLSTYTVSELAAQLSQIDISSFLGGEGGEVVNDELLVEMIANLSVGSILNSPSSGSGSMPWTTDQWRALNQRIYDISSTQGSKIPILYGLDTVHGANYIYNATLFPQQIGCASTFNTTVAYEMGRIGGLETRYVGIPWVFSPILGLAVQPSWARVFETFGEDPKLVGDMGVAIIKGLQEKPPPELNASTYEYTVAACMKHYIGYTNVRTGRDRTPVFLPMNILLQYFAPPFHRAITEANVLSAMENYIELNGRPVVASELILKFLLRTVMNFTGMLVTDYDEIFNLADFHMAADNYVDALEMSLNATTIDMAMVGAFTDYPLVAPTVLELVDEGRLDMNRVMDSARRVMVLKEKLGLLSGVSPVPNPTGCVFACDSHRQAGLDAARQSIILLQNDGILPLSTAPQAFKKVSVVGRGCDSKGLMAGGWTIHWQGSGNESNFPYGTTLYSELRDTYTPDGAQVVYAQGCDVTEDSTCAESDLTLAVNQSADADVVIICVGERHYAEKPGDIDDITLPGEQILMVNKIAQVNPNIVLVLIEGRPRVLQNLPALSRAVVHAWLPGPSGGQALREVLTGTVNPSGKLPITYPSTVNNAPIQYWRKYSANTDGDYTVQWPFGHGLSYSNFSYLDMSVKLNTRSGNYDAHVTVKNLGPYPGAHTVLLFSTHNSRPITPEVQMLRAFNKTFFNVNETIDVTMSFPFIDTAYYDEYNCRINALTSILFSAGSLSATAYFPVELRYQCNFWGQHWSEHTGDSTVPNPAPSPVTLPGKSSTPDYMISSIVCFGAGIVGTVIIISYLRMRGQQQQEKQQTLLEPSGI